MGTVYNQPELFRPLLDGLEGHGSALVTVGRNVDPGELGALPPRVRVERFVPQAHVLPLAAAVVSHGGSGTTLGALAYGLPLVLVPQAADQFDNAARAEKSGVAVVLRPGEVTAASVRAALARVLGDPAFAAAARTIAAEIAQMGTVDEVAGAVEEFIGGG
jgi:MGT family glycosyltransferase